MAKYAVLLAAAWTLLVISLALWIALHEMQKTRELVRNEARTHFLKDQAFRYWGAAHGGVYVPPTDHTLPNPYLSHIPDRDIVTTEGKKLTLMNPAYMIRQTMEDYEEQYGAMGHLTSLKPLRPKNAPDEWERTALESFDRGNTEVNEFTEIDGKPYLRLMRPVIVKTTCLKCHGHQGYKEGDVRGGFGVSIPAGAYYAAAHDELVEHTLALGLLWLLGLAALAIGARNIRGRVRERNRAEEALRDSEAKFRTYISSAPDGIFIADAKGHYVEVNQAACDLTGYSEPELTNMAISDIIDPETYNEALESFENLRKRGIAKTEFRLKCKDGSIAWTSLDAVALSENRFMAFCTDISETKRLQELEARAARLELAGTIAGQVAHDFNNLLAPIMAYPEFIRDEFPRDHKAHAYLDSIEEAAKKISEISQDLLTMGRRGHYNQEVIDLNRVVLQTALDIQSRIKTVTVKTDLCDDLMKIKGGSAQIHRMLTNLLVNAQDAMQNIGQVTIKTENYYADDTSVAFDRVPRGEYVKLTVSDNGCGIPDDIIQKILDPFFSTKSADKKCGSGLGLSVVDAVVKDHGGYLDLETKLGKGTSFYVYFPITRGSLDEKPSYESIGGNETVLVIDDDEVQRNVSTNLLKKLGYETSAVESGEKAIKFLRENPQDLLILDMVMPPGMDGTETYRRILDINPNQKAIIVSGFSESDRVREAQALGIGAFVKKPLTKKAIAVAVREELDRQAKVMV
ncbi:MAG: PAS domain S-box protein [candidate division Zixibacteria bacterium]